ncbi:hypothetical protein [Aurantiacibacter zhengii]|uniref:Flagellar hook-length control protein FliK n=1 Tax=Aurantiacibacter zhengii TaxID=2307003 RepID=A0A418NRS7_9SPHN|nr:hypothetical protein [Aurantiacibacter zhengii]RIV85791.1 hypothetical protein D2V07_10725 [Aurantiacibacter zhengii]
MNLFDLVPSSSAGVAAVLSGPAAQGNNPQESGLFGSFADLFAFTLAAPQAAPAVEGEEVANIVDGNGLPEETGKELPVAVAALPFADLPVAQPLDGAPSVSPQDLSPAPAAATAPGKPIAPNSVLSEARSGEARAALPESETVAPPLPRSEVQAAPGKSTAPAELTFAARETVALALRPVSTATASQIRMSESPVTQPAVASDEPQQNRISAEKVARFMPVAQLLRPVTANAPVPASETPAEALPENRPQSIAPAAPSSPVSAPLAQAAVVPSGEIVRPIAPPSQPEPAPALQRHDFGQVVEKLSEARELARPARAEMQVMHREFGTVSMQFDATGSALKVALASAHAGFAPAVQAALAERPVAPPAEAARIEVANHEQAQTGVQSSTSAQSAMAQSDGESAHQQQGRHPETQRAASVQANRGEQAEAAERDAPHRRDIGRDSALFA